MPFTRTSILKPSTVGEGENAHHTNVENIPLLSGGGVYGSRKSIDSLHYSVATEDIHFISVNSTANDHLSNERTFLGWMFLSLCLLGASMSIMKHGEGDIASQVEGFLTGLIGLIVLLTSTQRYFNVMRMLDQGRFEPNVHSILFIIVTIMASIGIFFAFYFSARSET